MAKRFTDTELWDKEWFMKLNPTLKCLVKFVRDKADLSGVWSPNWTIANTYIGAKVNEKMLLEIDGGDQFIKLLNGKIFCKGFVEFQYGELSEKSPVHKKIINMLRENDILNTYKTIGYQYPIQYPINRVQEEEEEKAKEKENKEKEVAKKSEFFNEAKKYWFWSYLEVYPANGQNPSFDSITGAKLKSILLKLRTKSDENGHDWNAENMQASFGAILTGASQMKWLRENFNLKNIDSQFDLIIQYITKKQHNGAKQAENAFANW